MENNAFLLCEQYGHSQAEEPPPRRVIKFLAPRNYILNYSALLLGVEKMHFLYIALDMATS